MLSTRTSLHLIAALSLLLLHALGIQAALPPDEIFNQVSPAVVTIIVRGSDGSPIAQGSGVVISQDGLIVTNYHVAQGADSIAVEDSKRRQHIATGWVAYDPVADLFLFRVPEGILPHVELANALPPIGSRVYAIGSPKGFAQTISEGLLSGIRGVGSRLRWLQTTAPVAPGSSGGILLNDSRQLIGLTTFKITDAENLNFAAPVQSIRSLRSSSHHEPQSFQTLPGYWVRRVHSLLSAQRTRFGPDYWYLLAEAQANIQDIDAANTSAAFAYASSPPHLIALGLYPKRGFIEAVALAYARLGDFETAVKTVNTMHGFRNSTLREISSIASEYDLPEVALDILNRMHPEGDGMSSQKERGLMEVCSALNRQGRTVEAVALAKTLSESDQALVLSNMTAVLIEKDQFVEAKRLLDAFTLPKYEQEEVLSNMTAALVEKDQLDEAKKLLDEISTADMYARVKTNGAASLAAVGKFDAANQWAQAVRETGYRSPDLARVLAEIGDDRGAQAVLKEWHDRTWEEIETKPEIVKKKPEIAKPHTIEAMMEKLLAFVYVNKQFSHWRLYAESCLDIGDLEGFRSAIAQAEAFAGTQRDKSETTYALEQVARLQWAADDKAGYARTMRRLEALEGVAGIFFKSLKVGDFTMARSALDKLLATEDVTNPADRELEHRELNPYSYMFMFESYGKYAGKMAASDELLAALLSANSPPKQVVLLLGFADGLAEAHMNAGN